MLERLMIRSYFSQPTDLADEMASWPEFVEGDGYFVSLLDTAAGEAVIVQYVEENEDCYVTISSSGVGPLFEKVVGKTAYCLSADSDDIHIMRKDR
jgi:hypothetical protein